MSQTHQEEGRDRFVGLACILLTLAGWTIVPLLIKMFTDDVDPWTSNGWRYGFAALLWAPLVVVKLARGRLPVGLFRAALVPGLINAAAQVVFTMSFYKIDPGLVTFGLRVQIVAVTIGAAIMFPSERRVIRSPLFLLGVLLVIGGTLVTTAQSIGRGGEDGVAVDRTQQIIGILCAMGAGGGYAAYALAVRRCMSGFGAMESFAAISQYTAVAMIVLMLILGERSGLTALDMPAPRFGLFLLSAAIGIAAGHVLYYWSIGRLGVAVSTGVVQLQPFTVGVLSVVAFGERLAISQWFSGSIAVIGAIVMLVVQQTMRQRAPDTNTVEDGDDAFEEFPPDAVAAMATDDHDARAAS
ncbi:MAG: hypothetical protein CMJ31_06195 [Phycisphaerae bacterium]|nr:hypothetical protein [Phycisphaerae bacterium]